ncbi:MAG: DUF1338 domain-containing protein, partial [Proteobacteria bacterium]
SNSRAQLNSLFENLWTDYTAFNPRAKRIYDLILAHEQKHDSSVKALINDHVALRTYDLAPIGLDALGALFTKYGYVKKDNYLFNEKKLNAFHYEHEDPTLPKVFISELETAKLSPLVQETARKAASEVSVDDVKKDSFLWSRRPWKASFSTYQQLLKESEYAAWMYAFGFRSNHFTISVNSLKSFADLQELNAFVKASGYELNTSGGEVKGTPKECLEQSSTLAEKASVSFDDGSHEIPSCYYEFARRHPTADGKLYQGFIAASADKIFESTNVAR